jgi:hypothetical protein
MGNGKRLTWKNKYKYNDQWENRGVNPSRYYDSEIYNYKSVNNNFF